MFGIRIETPFGEIKDDSPDKTASDVSNTINRELSNLTGGASAENVAVNILTGGMFGYENGQIGAGAITRANVEGIGELTGANQARRANNIAEQALRDQRAEAERLRQEELDRMKRNDIAASRKAGQEQANSYLTASSAAGTQAYNNLTRDFLGL